ncbi:MAG TPA: histidine phosphatase family protein [Candidatus Saccharimonadales bacterium]|nr:histidine phosphatase family protein [Candidatus Saccharimonadales bacterium]
MEIRSAGTSQRIIVVRHGETAWSREKRHTGRSDLPLTAEGREQARALGAQLEGLRFEAVFVSPLRRARETCELAGFADRAAVDPDLIEWDYGDYEGLTSAEIRERRPGWTLFPDGVIGGETLDDVAARADRVVARARSIDGDVLLFGHGHQLRILTALWLEFPASAAQHLQLATASPSALGFEHDWTALLSWNGLQRG